MSDQAAAQTPTLGYGMALLKMVLALVVVCAVAYVVLRYGVGRLTRLSGQTGWMKVLDRCPLGVGKTLWLVRTGPRCFLLGGSESSLSVLAELDPAEIADLPAGRPTDFRSLLGRRVPRSDSASATFENGQDPPSTEGDRS